MITEIALRNIGPFQEVSGIFFRPSSFDEHPEMVLESKAYEDGVLSSSIVLGPNATGKSILLSSLKHLRELVVEGKFHHDPTFANGSPSEISISMAVDFIPYVYTVSYDSSRIVSESLYQYATGRRSVVFTRSGDGYRFGKGLSKGRKSITDSTGPDRCYISVAAKEGDLICASVYDEISRIHHVSDSSFEDLKDPELLRMVVRSLRLTDFCITDIDVTKRTVTHDYEGEKRTISYDKESEGTRRMVSVMISVCSALSDGGLAVIDDIDINLNSRIPRWMMEQFRSDRNPGCAQLLATTNDVTLLDIKNLLRRDQVSFISRNRHDGTSRITPLTEFGGIRKDTDVEKAYLSWRFDALPRISSSEELIKR